MKSCRPLLIVSLLLPVLASAGTRTKAGQDPRLEAASRHPDKAGWIFVHLEGDPGTIGYQHGYLMAPEIEDNKKAIELSTTHEVKKSWAELRAIAEKVFWPQVPAEYRAELQGIVEGLHAQGSHLDVIDLVAMNGYME